MWSDECSIERKDGHHPVWVFRYPHEKWHQDCLEPEPHNANISQMIWGCFVGRSTGGIVQLNGDSSSARGGVTGRVVLDEALQPCLPSLFDDHPERIFMQDNAPVHRWHLAQEWLQEQEWMLMDWPPYSPDLNPIEHVWHVLKRWIHKHYPELLTMTGSKEQIKDKIWAAAEEAWYDIKPEFLWSLIESMPNRVQAVLNAHGGYTRY